MRRYQHQVLAGLLFISVVLIAVIVFTGAGTLADKLRDFPVLLLIPVFLLKVVNWALRYAEWRYFLGVIGVRTVHGDPARAAAPDASPAIHERDSILLWLAGLTLSLSPGKLAEVLKSLVVKNLTGVPFSRTVPVVFIERLVDGLAVILLAAGSLILAAPSFAPDTVSPATVRGVLIGTTLALLAGIAVLQIRPLADWLLDRLRGWPLVGRFHEPLRTLYDATYDLLRLRHLVITVGFGLGAYFTDCIGFTLLLRGLGVTLTWTLLAQATFILGFSVIIAALSAMPGGAGGRELTVGALLSGIVGLSKADTGTATFLISIFQVWLGVLVGLGVIVLARHILFPPALDAEIAAYEAARSAASD
ncbi:MAG TPA: lysylphosphatidylglycerol synthase transmembrane domain-containing protein [Aggregatilinea sp.]|uniref:lysylphosphatidylglycerol synthase transmembrane domain-containing protein n=1 Tax=Aggregatilinea sp. TaxID=2806333 RepID=UPI002CCD5DFF|nr:lysylphosphatidylglycerol synthase transmembrane domain-containing protein [Aggregatilinea sp.]HML21481.1 lysylphosphatidylglycerol synthase transmembrane domain-containing protein [Aggregatilinea sp.]